MKYFYVGATVIVVAVGLLAASVVKTPLDNNYPWDNWQR